MVFHMSDQTNQPPRRPGPIGFHAEAKVTSLRTRPADNREGIGEAKGPTRETPRSSKELKVWGPAIWGTIGVVLSLMGAILLTPVIVLIGLVICVGAALTNRNNRTEKRLRSEFKSRSHGE